MVRGYCPVLPWKQRRKHEVEHCLGDILHSQPENESITVGDEAIKISKN